MSSLSKFLGLKKLDFWEVPLHQYAHVIIDVQKRFCDPGFQSDYIDCTGTEETDLKAKHIANVSQKFRAAGIKTFIIYSDKFDRGLENDIVRLHHLTVEDGDILIPKKDDSAFREGARTHSKLQEHGITHLLISGFNAHACVKDTVLDAIVGYKYKNIALMSDMIGDAGLDDEAVMRQLKEMEQHGAIISSSQTAISKLSLK